MRPIVRELVAGGGASGLLVGLTLATQMGFVPVLVLAAAAYLGLRWTLPDANAREVAKGITRRQLTTAIDDVRAKAARFDRLGERLRASSSAAHAVPAQLAQIAETVRGLIVHIERDPENLRLASDFVDLQLPKALEIVDRYAWLAEQPHLDAASRAELDRTGQTIAMMTRAFESQHGRMLESDFREFSVDRRVFEELLRLDGELGHQLDDLEPPLARRARSAAGDPPPPPPPPPNRKRNRE